MAGWVGGSFVRFVHRRRVVAFKPFYIPSSQHTPVYPPAASNPFFAHPHTGGRQPQQQQQPGLHAKQI